MRCFVAVDLSKELINRILALQEELKELDLKLVEPENLHFTLKFLGEVDVRGMDEVSRRLMNIAERIKPFNIEIKNVGVFPNEKLIRVVWIGAPELLNLHIAVENAFGKSENEPTPHLTIARVRGQDKKLLDFIMKNKNIHMGGMRVDCLKLKKSTVMWSGPVYEDLKVFKFEG